MTEELSMVADLARAAWSEHWREAAGASGAVAWRYAWPWLRAALALPCRGVAAGLRRLTREAPPSERAQALLAALDGPGVALGKENAVRVGGVELKASGGWLATMIVNDRFAHGLLTKADRKALGRKVRDVLARLRAEKAAADTREAEAALEDALTAPSRPAVVFQPGTVLDMDAGQKFVEGGVPILQQWGADDKARQKKTR